MTIGWADVTGRKQTVLCKQGSTFGIDYGNQGQEIEKKEIENKLLHLIRTRGVEGLMAFKGEKLLPLYDKYIL